MGTTKMLEWLQGMHPGFGITMLASVVFVAAAHSAGNCIIKFFGDRVKLEPYSKAVVAFALGINALALVALALGMAKGLHGYMAWSIGLIFAVPYLCLSCRGILSNACRFIRKNLHFSIILFVFGCYTLGSALCYPSGWDEMTYHIALPYRWIAANNVEVFADNPYSGFPSLPQLVYTLGILSGGVLFPRLLVWYCFMVFFFAVYLLFARHGRKRLAAAFSFVFIFSPIFFNVVREAYAEVFVLLNFASCLMVTLRNPSRNLCHGNVAICGVLAGAMAAVKLNGLAPAALSLLVVLSRRQSPTAKRIGLATLVFSVGFLIFAVVFYLRPFIDTGNPTFPMLARVFTPSNQAYVAVSDFHSAMVTARYGGSGVFSFFSLPVMLAFADDLFDGISAGWILPVMIAVCLAGLRHSMARPVKFKDICIPICITGYYIFWFFTAQQTRFLVPMLLLLCLCAIRVLTRVPTVFVRTALMFIFSGCLLSFPQLRTSHYFFSWKHIIVRRHDPLKFIAGATKDQAYVKALEKLYSLANDDSKALLLFERRGLYVPIRYELGTPFFQSKYFTPLPDSHDELYAALVANGIKYVLVGHENNNPDLLSMYEEKNMILAGMLICLAREGKLPVIWSSDGYAIASVPDSQQVSQ
ncbi:MAG: hypothetical protein JW808_09275 [Victivallales bacterium]|nr:hypothetical protein [Victivallales bacterium]